MDWTAVGQWSAVVAALVAAFIAYRKAPSERRVLDAQAQDFISQAAARLVDDLEGQLKRAAEYAARIKAEREEIVGKLEGQIEHLEQENDRLRRRVDHLEQQIGA